MTYLRIGRVDCPAPRLCHQVSRGVLTVVHGFLVLDDVASVLEVVVNEGDQVSEGDTVVLLESMKMEIPVLAEHDGTVTKVSVSVGDVIQAGDLIAVIS